MLPAGAAAEELTAAAAATGGAAAQDPLPPAPPAPEHRNHYAALAGWHTEEGDKPADALSPEPKAALLAPAANIGGVTPEASRAQAERVSKEVAPPPTTDMGEGGLGATAPTFVPSTGVLATAPTSPAPASPAQPIPPLSQAPPD